MKRSLRPLLLMCLPVVLILAVGLYVNHLRDEARRQLIAYYSQPFTPEVILSQSTNLPPLYEWKNVNWVKARFVSLGGRGKSQWLVRGRVLDVSSKEAREMWNSQVGTAPWNSVWLDDLHTNETTSDTFFKKGTQTLPESHGELQWTFIDTKDKARRLRFDIEAVVIPSPDFPTNYGNSAFLMNQAATAAQLAAAKNEPGAIYLHKTIDLNSSGVSKDTPNQ